MWGGGHPAVRANQAVKQAGRGPGWLCRLPPWQEPLPRTLGPRTASRLLTPLWVGGCVWLSRMHLGDICSSPLVPLPPVKSTASPSCPGSAWRLGGGRPALGGLLAAAWQSVCELAVAQGILWEARESLTGVDKMADQGTPTGRGPGPVTGRPSAELVPGCT